MLFTGIGVLLASKLVVLGDNFNLNRWRKKKKTNNPNGSFWLRFLDTGWCRHISNSDLSRPQTESNGSYVLWTERSHSITHFISCRLENPFGRREWTEYESVSWSDDSVMRWRGCERNEETMQNSQEFGWTEHNCEYRRWHFVVQLDSSFRSAILEQTENWSRMEEANGAIWREDLVS